MAWGKKIVLGGLLVSAGTLYAWQYGQPSSAPPLFGGGKGTTAPERNKKAPQSRTLTGTVFSQEDAPLPHAIVYLKNLKTLTIKTYIAGPDGTYQFNALSPNIDYEFYAELDGKKSSTKTLSSFDSRPKATINIRIEIPKTAEQSKQAQQK